MTALELQTTGSIFCMEDCLYSRECANHYTAGDFRMKNGFSPQVIVRDATEQDRVAVFDKVAICETRNANPVYEEKSYSKTLPINHEELGKGKISYDFKVGAKYKDSPYREFRE
jgi:hypothetical protein